MMSERSSVDAAARRREARRRRILENSEKRLESIIGRPISDPNDIWPEPDNCFLNDFQNPLVNELFKQAEESLSPESDAEEDSPSHKPRVNDVDEEDAAVIKTATGTYGFGSTWMRTVVHKRFHFIILSLIVQLLYIFKLGHLFYNNLFCPFITVKLMEFWLVQESFKMDYQEQIGLMSAVFQGSMARHMVKAFSVLAVIASDFCLYIFIIVASDKLFSVIISPYLAH